MTAYGVDNIMSPLAGGDITLMREAFPEVPAGSLVSTSGEVSLLMGQDNLSLFPTERRRVGNAALYMSRFGTGWIAQGKPPRARSGGSIRHVGVCVIEAVDPEATDRPEPHEEVWIPIRNCLYQKFIYVSKTIERLTPSYSI